MAFCPSCGAPLPEGSRFCTECGIRLEAAPATITPPVPETEEQAGEVSLPVPEEPSAEPEIPAAPESAPESEPEFAPESAPVFVPPAAEVSQSASAYQQPASDPEKPGRKSKYAPMTAWGMAIQLILMNIPVIGFILMVVWACGGCRKISRRNLARANLILLILAIALTVIGALLVRFAFADVITRVFEQLLPGYTLQWG